MYEALKQKGIHIINEFLGDYEANHINLDWSGLWTVVDIVEGKGYHLQYLFDGNKYFFAFKKGNETFGSYSHSNRIEALYMCILFFINGYNAKHHPDRRWR